jgi:hypothetical protein
MARLLIMMDPGGRSYPQEKRSSRSQQQRSYFITILGLNNEEVIGMANAIKLVAVKEFDGLEGFIKKGQEFEVKRKDRAEALKAAGLAEDPKKAASKEDKAAK